MEGGLENVVKNNTSYHIVRARQRDTLAMTPAAQK